ncbi:MAG: MBL fold metallo-hydrolase [Gordonia sp. (in: high G+C Gram-positive bacteria)]
MQFEIDSLTADDSTVHFVSTSTVNWVILQSSEGVTLIDGGYPGHASAVLEALDQIGSAPEEIRGALLTHAHVDHLGGLRKLRADYDFPVYADPEEVAHVHRDYLEQADVGKIAPILWRPSVLGWLAQIIPLGALDKAGIDDAQPFGDLSALPGRPVAVPSHGHTRGHSAFLVGDGELLISGDALVTAHSIQPHDGPQCLSHIFTHDLAANEASVETFADLDAEVILPGHGPLYRGPMRAAVDQALGRSAAR